MKLLKLSLKDYTSIKSEFLHHTHSFFEEYRRFYDVGKHPHSLTPILWDIEL